MRGFLFYVLVLAAVLRGTVSHGQTVMESVGPIVLPQSSGGTYTVASGASLTAVSETSITLNSGVTFQSGSVVLLKIGPVGDPEPEPEWGMNWTETKVFGHQGGIIGETRTYYDDLGRELQTLSRDISNGNVLVGDVIYDALGNASIRTLPVPVTGIPQGGALGYRDMMVRNALGNPYSYRDFDDYYTGIFPVRTDKRHDPNPVGNTVPHTLGWYYGNNNSIEGYVDVSSHPYMVGFAVHPSLSKAAGTSSVFRMGQGHETVSFTATARGEIDHYLEVANKFFTNSEIGNLPNHGNIAVSHLSINEDKKFAVGITLNDRSIISAVAGNDLQVNNYVSLPYDPISGTKDIPIAILSDQVVSMTGTGTIVNISGNEQSQPFAGAVSLAKGVYEFKPTGTGSLSYQTGLADLSYNFYNEKGILLASIAPKGVKSLLTQGLSAFNTIADVPFTTLYQHDSRGFLAAVISSDNGETVYSNRSDGAIRFSQNAVQLQHNVISYTSYDPIGRPIEQGEALGVYDFASTLKNGWNGSHNARTLLEYRGDNRLQHISSSPKATRDVVQYAYDDVDNSHGLTGYTQDAFFLQGAVSTVTKYSYIGTSGPPQPQDMVSKSWYGYNGDGSIKWQVRYIHGLGYKTTDYAYDGDGLLVKKIYQKDTPAERMVYYYEYDGNKSPIATYTNTVDNPSGKILHTWTSYYAHGGIKRVELGDELQGIDYVYTVDGKLKAINHANGTDDPGQDGMANGFAPDVFGMNFEYHPNDYQRTGTNIHSIQTGSTAPNYAGPVNGISWNVQKPTSAGASSPVMNTYQYDNKYQLVQSNWGTPNYSLTSFTNQQIYQEKGLTYDVHGNIQTLQRTGGTGNTLASYQYSYAANSNRLTSVSNYASYTYDALGQLSSETKGSMGKYLEYDAYGKVTRIYSDAAKTNLVLSFAYDENGSRIKKQDHLQNVTTWYVDGNVYNGTQLIEQPIPSGIYYRQAGVYRYQLTDHIGSVRAIINRDKLPDGSADVVYYADYYPFGSLIQSAGIPSRYGYQGEYAEKDDETGWNSFLLRNYDSEIGRWLSIDPYGQYYSPYVGMGNDPINRFDPDGGWDKLTAKWKWWGAFFRGESPSRVYENGAGEWGFNFTPKNVPTDAGGIATVYAGSNFGPNRRAQEVTQGIIDNAWGTTGRGYQQNMVTGEIKGSGMITPVYVEFDIALTTYTGGQYWFARQAARELATKTGTTALTKFYPANNGFLGAAERTFLMPGQQISRFGSNSGKFFSPAGTPLPMRALPPGANTSIHNTFKVLKPFEVQAGKIAPAFGQPGLGTQYLSPVSVDVLLKRGIIGY